MIFLCHWNEWLKDILDGSSSLKAFLLIRGKEGLNTKVIIKHLARQ